MFKYTYDTFCEYNPKPCEEPWAAEAVGVQDKSRLSPIITGLIPKESVTHDSVADYWAFKQWPFPLLFSPSESQILVRLYVCLFLSSFHISL